MAKAEAIIFDIYNTLLHNQTDEERKDTYAFLSLWLSYHGVRINPADLRHLYLDLCHEEIEKSGESFPDIDIGKVFSVILADGGDEAMPSNDLVSEFALLFRMCTTNYLSPFPGVMAMLNALRGRVKLGIASNAQRLFTIPELGRFSMIEFFDVIVLSSDLGISKPNPKIFLKALGELSAQPETTVYVGDNPFADIHGAQGVGMKAIWVNRGQQNNDSQFKPDYQVRDELALTEILLRMVS